MPAEGGSTARQGGFTLLEVLVAFVIAALALGVLFQGSITSLRSVRLSGQYMEAVSRARSHLAAFGRQGGLIPGVRSGEDGNGFRWRTQIQRVAVHAPPPGQATPPTSAPLPALYAIGVTISWGEEGEARQVTLQSRRLGSAVPEPP